jgi:hypothetical protein
MIVVEERQRYVRPRSNERFDRAVIDGRIAESLEDKCRLREGRVERVVAQAVLLELNVERSLFVIRVMKERERTAAAPFLDAFGRQ